MRAGIAGRLHPRGLSATSRHSAQAYAMAGKVKPSRLSRSYARPLRALPNDAAKSQAREVGSTYAWSGVRSASDVYAEARDVVFHTVRTSIMSNKPEQRLDRRDFMIASIATVGASAALTANAGSANAQDSATSATGTGRAISNGLYRRYNPGEEGRQRPRRQRPGARQETPSVF